jgi:hypothetical protein
VGRAGLSLIGVLTWASVASAFSIPHLFWPQRDIQPAMLNDSTAEHRVLVASRSSPFKDSIVAMLKTRFASRSVFVRFVGLKELDRQDAAGYDAVVLINTCMSWDPDRRVLRFLHRNRDAHGRIIVLTTSGSGHWEPRKRGRVFDAVTAASAPEYLERTIEALVTKVEALVGLAGQPGTDEPAEAGKE